MTRTFTTTWLFAAAVASFCLADAPGVSAQSTCGRGATEEQACFASWAAQSKYQEIIDYIETKAIGLSAHEKYFLGIAYYSLSGRTGAQSLRCFYTTRAKAYLESFLENRQQTMKELGVLGSADEVNYSYIATRALESARRVTGCEESGETLAALGRHARRFLSSTIEDLFFSYGTPGGANTPARARFDAQMKDLQDKVRGFVGTVSMMETNYQLTEIELSVGFRDLGQVVTKMNEWRPGAITPNEPSGRANYAFDKPMDELLADIAQREQVYRELAMQGGALGSAKATIDRFILASGASGMKDYDERRTGTVAAAKRLVADLTAVDNETTSLLRTNTVMQLSPGPGGEPTGMEQQWSAIEQEWRKVKPACEPDSSKWYCQ